MSEIPTKTQVSAGGVIFRLEQKMIEVALISVGEPSRWQLPKGLVEQDEPHEVTATREVQEETGIQGELIGFIDRVEYWYYSKRPRARFHKFVYFYLFRYTSGTTDDHDHEVNEARWVVIDEAIQMLAFKSEKDIVEKAKTLLAS
jgi:8-oxo-dGTP pyrophosphatase MutT (NUDIX family)